MTKRTMISLDPFMDPKNYTMTPYWAYGVGLSKGYDSTLFYMDHYTYNFNADGTSKYIYVLRLIK